MVVLSFLPWKWAALLPWALGALYLLSTNLEQDFKPITAGLVPGVQALEFSLGHENSFFSYPRWELLSAIWVVFGVVYGYCLFYFPKSKRGEIDWMYPMLALFLLGMAVLCLAATPLAIVAGWESIGLAGYVLVNHYRSQPTVAYRATLVFWVNRVGDVFLLVAVCLHLNMDMAYNLYPDPVWGLSFPVSEATVYLFYVLAALVKSVALPFSGWLIWAMAGPTPISALLHSATLVLGGILVISNPIMPDYMRHYAFDLQHYLGLATALYGGFKAVTAKNLKPLLAWSTVAHMGLILSVSGGDLPFHALSHAYFKTGLFLCLGLIALPAQLIREWPRVGALKRMPLENGIVLVLIALFLLALNGFPPFAAMHTKYALLQKMETFLDKPYVIGFMVLYSVLAATYSYIFFRGMVALLAKEGALRLASLPMVVIVALLVPFLFKEVGFHNYGNQLYSPSYGWVLLLVPVVVWGLQSIPSRLWPYSGFIKIATTIEPESTYTVTKAFGNGLVQSAKWLRDYEGRTLALFPLTLARVVLILATVQAASERFLLRTIGASFRLILYPLRDVIDDAGALSVGRALYTACFFGGLIWIATRLFG
jgi:NADH:ubiquinone oxidoreductase subunit 5 (subunit L)/multisubunit Na+/H+ antiporter MnhA subunit